MKNKTFLSIAIIFILSVVAIIFVFFTNEESEDSSENQSDLPAFSENSGINNISDDISKDSESSQNLIEASSEIIIEESSEAEASKSYEEIIGINYKIDIESYLEYIAPRDESLYNYLVNTKNPLSSSFVPENLIDIASSRYSDKAKMCFTAAKALEAFLAEGALNGVTDVTVTSGYRSYASQDWWFNYYVDKYIGNFNNRAECEEYVMTFSMKAGFSEHQTGLVIDMHNLSEADVSFQYKAEAVWLAENAYRFGFILRYPADKTTITGIMFEPWHFRFVGRETATYLYQNNLCLEEFYSA